MQDSESAAMGGESAAIAAFAEEPNLDGSAITAASENNQVEEGGGGGGGSAAMGGGGEIITYLEREYVWGPGDRGVDELLVQFDREREPWWAVQDAGLDAIALCDLGGTPTSHFPNGTARVVAQFGYDAYGSVVTAESLFAHALLRAGHKGLFFDRLDLGIVDPLSLEETPRLAVGADVLGNARNRAYSPRLGRWVQRDPKLMGSGEQSRHAIHGLSLGYPLHQFDLLNALHDGANAYGYLRAGTWIGADALGLEFFILPMLEVAKQEMQQISRDVAKLGLVDAARMAILRNMSGIYYSQLLVADSMLAEFSGVGLGPAGVGVMLYDSAAALTRRSASAGQLLTFTSDNFVSNLKVITGLTDANGFQGHHMVPQALESLLKTLGIDDMLHNPLLGQWVEAAAHGLMQPPPRGGAYNADFKKFLESLLKENVMGNDARLRVLGYLREVVVPTYEQYGLRPLPWY